jgi:hypothetical protein
LSITQRVTTIATGSDLTRFFNYNVHGTAPAATQPPNRDITAHAGANPFESQLGDVFVTTSRGRGLYRGATFGLRKRYSSNYQLEFNYVLAKDEGDGQLLSRTRGSARRRPAESAAAGTDRATDYDLAAGGERRRSRAQLGPQGQRPS